MIPSNSWGDLIGFIFGIMCTVFAITVANLLKQPNPVPKVVRALFVFSFSIAFVCFLYALADFEGFFEEWSLLGRLSLVGENTSEPAAKILDYGYIQAQNGNVYHFTYQGCQKGCWERGDINPKNENDTFVSSSGDCGSLPLFPKPKEDFVAIKAGCVAFGPGLTKVVFAIDKYGSVWSWMLGGGEFDGLEVLVFPIFYGTISCLSGLSFTLLWLLPGFLKKKIFKHNSQTGSLK